MHLEKAVVGTPPQGGKFTKTRDTFVTSGSKRPALC